MVKRRDKPFRILPPDRFKGKKIILAATDEVEANDVVACEFMSVILELDPGDYLITDESDVLDFVPFDSKDVAEIWARIEAVYGINQLDVGSGRLVRILETISKHRIVQ